MQLRRPATTSTWSNARGGQQVQRGENTEISLFAGLMFAGLMCAWVLQPVISCRVVFSIFCYLRDLLQ